jgi:isopentenyldiphosphate isomerase
MQAQDDGELFDLYTREGVPLGIAKPRALVHRDGDWHRSIHIWVWGPIDGAPHLVFQRRSVAKDTWPGALDVAVTGHARAGEPLEATLREAEEEIGLPVRLSDLVRLGRRRRSATPPHPGARPPALDNELQEIFAHAAPVEVAALTPSPAEVSALVALPFAEAGPVLRGEGAVTGLWLVRNDGEVRFVEERIAASDLVPAPDGYYARAYASLAVLLSGGAPEAWEIGER